MGPTWLMGDCHAILLQGFGSSSTLPLKNEGVSCQLHDRGTEGSAAATTAIHLREHSKIQMRGVRRRSTSER